MSKQLVAQTFSYRAKLYRSGMELDGTTFDPETLKAFQEQGKLVPAQSKNAEAIRATETVQDVSAANHLAAVINDGSNEQHKKNS